MQYDYINVYKSNETDFSHNGIRILCPTSCVITETLNGEYSLTLSHPFDDLGNWKFLVEYNIIKAQGQLFRIYRKATSMANDGTKQRTVDALHIFYDLNFYYIKDTRVIQKNGNAALDWIMSHTYISRGSTADADQPTARFTFTSDLVGATVEENLLYRHTAYYEDMSPTKALLGADNCFVNTWGGELKRDNFNVTINKRRGIDNAFNISYGVDMTEIEQDVDFSDFCGAIAWTGTYKYTYNGNDLETTYSGIASLHRLDLPTLPVVPMKSLSITLTEQDVADMQDESGHQLAIKAAFDKVVKDYMLANCSPIVNYRVAFANLKNFEMYKDFVNLQRCELGDIGTIYNDELGINTTQQVVKKTIDGITGEVTSIELGSLRKTFTSEGRVNGGYDSARTELIKNEISYNNTWENLGANGYTLESLNSSWSDLAGNVSLIEGDS